ncbi:hypothetical protein DESC_810091 [Desulfosarcina cetonica]|nr:hypothetical protein DESC_810091 [Desulfosarcina cetonica]
MVDNRDNSQCHTLHVAGPNLEGQSREGILNNFYSIGGPLCVLEFGVKHVHCCLSECLVKFSFFHLYLVWVDCCSVAAINLSAPE